MAGVQVTAGLGFFLYSSGLSDSKDSDSLLLRGLIPKRGLSRSLVVIVLVF